MQIFLSYASEDKAVAEPIAFSLRARGYEVFLDRDDLPAGGEYDHRIEKAIEQSSLFIFLISPRSVLKGRYTLSELEFARRKWRRADGHILPIMIAPTPYGQVPPMLKSVTILQPMGNIAAEVARAVAELISSRNSTIVPVFAGLGLVSGAISFPTLRLSADLFPNFFALIDLPGVLISGIPFAIALFVGSLLLRQFEYRLLLVPVSVMAAWSLALGTEQLLSQAHKPLFSNSTSDTIVNSQSIDPTGAVTERCNEVDSLELNTKVDWHLQKECLFTRLSEAESKILSYEETTNGLIDLGASGAVGAIATLFGFALALRKSVKPASVVIVSLVGSVVACAAVYIPVYQQIFDIVYQKLFKVDASLIDLTSLLVPWQTFVGATIGWLLHQDD